MRYIITALLSAALIWFAPHKPPINNSTTARAKAQTVQVAAPEKATEATQTLTEQKAVVVPEPVVMPVTPPTTHEQLMNQAGINPKDYGAADYIISHESSWRDSAREPHTGAYGLCQSLPAVKMASAGSDWQTDPVTQLRWCDSYALARYGGWQGAYAHWTAFRWW